MGLKVYLDLKSMQNNSLKPIITAIKVINFTYFGVQVDLKTIKLLILETKLPKWGFQKPMFICSSIFPPNCETISLKL